MTLPDAPITVAKSPINAGAADVYALISQSLEFPAS